MRNKLSLKTRITIIVGLVLVLIAGLLTFFSIKNMDRYMFKPQLQMMSIKTTDLPVYYEYGKGIVGEDILRNMSAEELEKSAKIKRIGNINKSDIIEDIRIGGNLSGLEMINIIPNDKISNYNFQKIESGMAIDVAASSVAIEDEIYIKKDMIQSGMTSGRDRASKMNIYMMIGIIIIGVGLVYISIDKALKPLSELTATIHNIGENDLNTQIELPDSDDEISSLINSFNGMLSRIEKMFNEEKDFSAKAAHELRTPLATMKTSLQVLQLDDNPSVEEYEENIIVTENNVDRLIGIVNNLFLMSSDDIKLNDRVNLKKIIIDSFDGLGKEIIKKNIQIDLKLEDIFINGNEELLESAIRNLIDNAVKYNTNNGTIMVDLNKDEEYVYLDIEDTGLGMDIEDKELLFKSFYRLDKTIDIEGNGLGLAIVKTVIDDHNGEIDFNTDLDEGTKFMIKIPLS